MSGPNRARNRSVRGQGYSGHGALYNSGKLENKWGLENKPATLRILAAQITQSLATVTEAKEEHVIKLGKKAAIVSVVAAAVVLFPLARYSARAKRADAQIRTTTCVSSVPSSWGAYKGGSAQSGLAFEDNAGTLRFVTNLPCGGAVPIVSLEVRRAIDNGKR